MQMESAQLDLVFSALADATRRAILARLTEGEASVSELNKPFALSQPAISKHLKVLEKAGLVVRGHNAQFRPRKLNAAPLQGAAQWIGSYQQFWDQSLDRLDAYVKNMQQELQKKEQEDAKP